MKIWEKLECLEVSFIQFVLKINLPWNEYLTYRAIFNMYLASFKESNVLFYNKHIPISELMDEEWYFQEDYTREILDTLEKENLITYQDVDKNTFSLNIDRNMLLGYVKIYKRIQSGKL